MVALETPPLGQTGNCPGQEREADPPGREVRGPSGALGRRRGGLGAPPCLRETPGCREVCGAQEELRCVCSGTRPAAPELRLAVSAFLQGLALEPPPRLGKPLPSLPSPPRPGLLAFQTARVYCPLLLIRSHARVNRSRGDHMDTCFSPDARAAERWLLTAAGRPRLTLPFGLLSPALPAPFPEGEGVSPADASHCCHHQESDPCSPRLLEQSPGLLLII